MTIRHIIKVKMKTYKVQEFSNIKYRVILFGTRLLGGKECSRNKKEMDRSIIFLSPSN